MDHDSKDGYLLRWPIWVAYALLLAIGIPWYWPAEDRTILLGMPAWVVVALAASLAISLLTAYLLNKPWPQESSETDQEAGE